MTDDKLAELRALAEKATPGPWHWKENGKMYGANGDEDWCEAIIETDSGVYGPHDADKELIARCDPQTILSLLDRIEEMREALKPFAAFSEKAERYVQGRADFGGSPIMPTKHFRLADFKRARSCMTR